MRNESNAVHLLLVLSICFIICGKQMELNSHNLNKTSDKFNCVEENTMENGVGSLQ